MKRKTVITFTGLGLAVLVLVSSCISFEQDTSLILDFSGNPVKEQWSELSDGNLHSIESGDVNGAALVFIHGTPGSLGFFSSYVVEPELSHTRTIAIDRPSWGASEVGENYAPTLTYQSSVLGDWLCDVKEQSPENKLVVVAHSYGATLTPKLIIDHPNCISAALLLAGGADPALTAPRWYNQLTHYPPVSWLASLSSMGLKQSNNEMMTVKTELEKIQNSWNQINIPITVIQGEEDGLVHPDNADFIETKLSHIPAKIIRIEEGGHVLRSSHKDLIISEILQLL